MTAEMSPLARTVSASLSLTNPDLPWLWQPLLRLLAQGSPVTTEQLASATGHSSHEVHQALAALPDTEYDDAGRIVGYGLTQRPTPHRFTVNGHQLYTWCALDTLIFPAVLSRTAQVESPCHATGTPVRLDAAPDGITNVEPATAVVSLVTPGQCTSVRTAFCNHVHFFASSEAAQGWLSEHPDATTLPISDAFELGHQLAQQRMIPDGPPGCC
ncbi:organomercurial lyase MerB [Saccharopolyspora sp. ID03-671]|uniref:organomercurial lyase MerB n=1 Tax=Saccharopolyspora sp. ID03-671 TaxID=3073066 RepID=UPI003247738D